MRIYRREKRGTGLCFRFPPITSGTIKAVIPDGKTIVCYAEDLTWFTRSMGFSFKSDKP
jgi:hypothetical protein